MPVSLPHTGRHRTHPPPPMPTPASQGTVIVEDDADDPMMRIFLAMAVLGVLVAYWLKIFWAKYAMHPEDEPVNEALTLERHTEKFGAGMHT